MNLIAWWKKDPIPYWTVVTISIVQSFVIIALMLTLIQN